MILLFTLTNSTTYLNLMILNKMFFRKQLIKSYLMLYKATIKLSWLMDRQVLAKLTPCLVLKTMKVLHLE